MGNLAWVLPAWKKGNHFLPYGSYKAEDPLPSHRLAQFTT